MRVLVTRHEMLQLLVAKWTPYYLMVLQPSLRASAKAIASHLPNHLLSHQPKRILPIFQTMKLYSIRLVPWLSSCMYGHVETTPTISHQP
jgi:hypothetical protein